MSTALFERFEIATLLRYGVLKKKTLLRAQGMCGWDLEFWNTHFSDRLREGRLGHKVYMPNFKRSSVLDSLAFLMVTEIWTNTNVLAY